MAKKSKIEKNKQRAKCVAKYADKRRELKSVFMDTNRTDEDREAAFLKLSKLPRDSSATRFVNRCLLTGRPHAYYRKFGLSRIAFRELALSGELPGVTKASW